MSLIASVADWILRELPYDRSNPDVAIALNSKHPGELLVLYYNWCNRIIPAHPRQVMRSGKLDQNPVVIERSKVVAEVIADIAKGADLTKYLSRRIRVGFELPQNPAKKKLARLQHLDLLLNDWGIYHLHLSTNVEADGFVKRDDPLLFAMFRPNKAYLLDIGTHDTFVNEALARIAIESWPADQLFVKLQGVLGLQRGSPYSSDERKQLRSAGIASFIQIGSQVYSPPGGISTAGTSARAAMWSNRVMRILEHFEEDVRQDPLRIIDFIRQHGGNPSEMPEFDFAMFGSGFGVIERQSGMPIRLSDRPAQ